MREITGGDYDELATMRPESNLTRGVVHDSSEAPQKHDERKSNMEHPEVHIKNEPKYIDHGRRDDRGMGDGFGGSGFLMGALLGRGLLGDRDNGRGDVERPVFDAAILGKLGTLEGAVPLVGSQTQTAIALSTGQLSTNALQIALGQAGQATAIALANQGQLSAVKDSVQAGVYANTLATIDQGEKTRALITANRISELESSNTTLTTTLLLERHGRGFDRDNNSLVIQNTNTANAMQQQQQSTNFQISRLFDAIHCCDQNIRATNQAFNFGSGVQVATPNNTSTNNRVN